MPLSSLLSPSPNEPSFPLVSSSLWFQQTLSVPLAFPVWFGRGLFSDSCPAWTELWSRTFPSRTSPLLLAIESAAFHHHANLPQSLRTHAALAGFPEPPPPLVFPGGESCKDGLVFVEKTTRWLASHGACRHTLLIAVGGGAFLDAVGLAAALWHRGLRLIRVPTTLLAQADSGVGVKCAVNWAGHKNGLGTFAAPFAVLNDLSFLDSLPPSVLAEGMTEAFKVALIRDASFFHWLIAHLPELAAARPEALAHLVQRSAQLHLDHIREGGDPFEFGHARPLDFGHWLAHELERQSGYQLSHGRAVAIGLAVDSAYAVRKGWLAPAIADDLARAWSTLGLPSSHPLLTERPAELLRSALDRFREHLGGRLSLTYPNGLGHSHQIESMNTPQMLALITHPSVAPRSVP